MTSSTTREDQDLQSHAPTREPGAGRPVWPWLLAAAGVLLPLGLLSLRQQLLYAGLTNPDALDFAQIGRNLAEGRGFTTFVLRPLALTHGDNPMQQPDVTHGPLYPMILALAFKLAGSRDVVAVAVSSIFYVLTIPAAFFLGRRVFGHRVGVLAALVMACSALMLEYAASGLPATLLIFLMTLEFHCLYNLAACADADPADAAANRRRTVLTLGAGALVALLYLAEPTMVWLWPVVLAAAGSASRAPRWKAVALCALPLVVLASPWMARNAIVAGEPVYALRSRELWMYTPRTYPGITGYRILPQDLAARPGLVQDIARKVLLGMDTVLGAWPQVAANWLLAFFLPSLLFRFSDQATAWLRRQLLWCLAAVLGGMLLFSVQMPIFVTFVPAALVYAIAYLLFLVRQAQLTRRGTGVLVGVMALVLMYPVVIQMVYQDRPTPPMGAATARALGRHGQADEVFLTTQPTTVAWYAKRPAILVPQGDARIGDLRRRFGGIRWLVLTPEAMGWSTEWQGVFRALEGWSMQWALTSGKPQAKPPAQLVVRGGGSPLMVALDGFASFPPLEPLQRNHRNVVVAVNREDVPPRQP